MTVLASGLWVHIRAHITFAPSGDRGPVTGAGRPIPKPFARISARSGVGRGSVGDRLDSPRQDTLVDSYTVAIEVWPRPANKFQSRVISTLGENLHDVVLNNAMAVLQQAEKNLDSVGIGRNSGDRSGKRDEGLTASLEIVPDDDVLGAFIGSRLPQARYVEFGARKSPARPYLFPALEARKHFIRGDIEQSVRRTLGIVSGAFLPVDRLGFPKLTGDPDVDSIRIWALYFDLLSPPVPVSVISRESAANEVDNDIKGIISGRSVTSEKLRDYGRRFIRIIDEQMKDPKNSPAGVPDPPSGGTPPPTGSPVPVLPIPFRRKPMALPRLLMRIFSRRP